MIIVLACGGLGNQLFEYAAGSYLREPLGGRVFVDRRFFHEARQKRRYVLRELGISLPEVGSVGHLLIRLARRLAHRHPPLHFLIRNRFINYIVDSGDGISRELTSSRKVFFTILDGYWQNYQYTHGQVEFLRRLLSTRTASPRARELIDRAQSTITLGLHIRRGDYVSDSQTRAVHGVCSSDYYYRALKLVRERRQIDVIYVFSDDIGWVKENLNFGQEALLVNTAATLTDLEEFIILASCHHFVTSNSTFSWWAALLGEAKDKMVVAPSRWFALRRDVENGLIPPTWHRI